MAVEFWNPFEACVGSQSHGRSRASVLFPGDCRRPITRTRRGKVRSARSCRSVAPDGVFGVQHVASQEIGKFSCPLATPSVEIDATDRAEKQKRSDIHRIFLPSFG